MSYPDQEVQFQEVATPKTLPEAKPEPAPRYLTVEEADRLREEILSRAQSHTDKTIGRLQEQLRVLKDTVEMQRKSGIEITPEQERNLRLSMIDQVLSNKPEEPQPSTQPAPPGGRGAEVHPINYEAARLFKEYGFAIEENDPEAGEILQGGKPEEWLDSIKKALDKKEERITQRRAKRQEPVRTPTTAGVQGAPTTSQEALMAQYKQQAKKIRPGSEEMLRLRAEYRQKGLDI